MWFGREGRHGVCIVAFSCCVFQTIAATPTMLLVYNLKTINHDHVNSFSSKKKKQEEKDNKKAS